MKYPVDFKEFWDCMRRYGDKWCDFMFFAWLEPKSFYECRLKKFWEKYCR